MFLKRSRSTKKMVGIRSERHDSLTHEEIRSRSSDRFGRPVNGSVCTLRSRSRCARFAAWIDWITRTVTDPASTMAETERIILSGPPSGSVTARVISGMTSDEVVMKSRPITRGVRETDWTVRSDSALGWVTAAAAKASPAMVSAAPISERVAAHVTGCIEGVHGLATDRRGDCAAEQPDRRAALVIGEQQQGQEEQGDGAQRLLEAVDDGERLIRGGPFETGMDERHPGDDPGAESDDQRVTEHPLGDGAAPQRGRGDAAPRRRSRSRGVPRSVAARSAASDGIVATAPMHATVNPMPATVTKDATDRTTRCVFTANAIIASMPPMATARAGDIDSGMASTSATSRLPVISAPRGAEMIARRMVLVPSARSGWWTRIYSTRQWCRCTR